jgi:hypothetical protein
MFIGAYRAQITTLQLSLLYDCPCRAKHKLIEGKQRMHENYEHNCLLGQEIAGKSEE